MKKKNHVAVIVILLLLLVCTVVGTLALLLHSRKRGGNSSQTKEAFQNEQISADSQGTGENDSLTDEDENTADGANHTFVGVTASMAETEVIVLSDQIFYRNVPEEHLALDEESQMAYVDDEILVRVGSGVTYEQVCEYLEDYTPTLAGYDRGTDAYEICLGEQFSEAELLSLCEDLEKQEGIAAAHVNYWLEGAEADAQSYGNTAERLSLSEMQVYSRESSQWSYADWGIKAVCAQAAWNYGYKMKAVPVAVWDFFCENTAHEDLTFKEVIGTGNGDANHGMHVSGILSADHNDRGVLGMAPTAVVYAQNMNDSHDFFPGPEGEDSPATYTVSGFEASFSNLLVEKKVRVINASWGYGDYLCSASLGSSFAQRLMTAVNSQLGEHLSELIKLHGVDFVICVAAGNENTSHYKKADGKASEVEKRLGYVKTDSGGTSMKGVADAKWDILSGIETKGVKERIIVVGAYQETSPDSGIYSMTDFSNGGDRVDVVAPGYSIYSTSSNGGYVTLEGTSMACPYAAGAAACLFALDDSLTGIQVKKIISGSQQEMTLHDDNNNDYHQLNMEDAISQVYRRVTGGVRDADTDEVLDGVQIDIYYEDELADSCYTSETGVYEMKLFKGEYVLELRKDGYETLRTTLTVDKNGCEERDVILNPTLKMKKGSISAYQSEQVYYENGISYIVTGFNGGSDDSRMEAVSIPTTPYVSQMIRVGGEVLELEYPNGKPGGCNISYNSGGTTYQVASDASGNAPFVYRDGKVFYFTADHCLMAVDKTGGSGYCVFRASDYGIQWPPQYTGAGWMMDCREDGLYFTPNLPMRIVYKMDYDTWQVGRFVLPSFYSTYLMDSFQTDRYYIYYTVGDAVKTSLIRSGLDGSDPMVLFTDVNGSGLSLTDGYLYFVKGETLVRWKCGDKSMQTEVVADDCGLLGISGGRVFYQRFEIYHGIDSVAMVYSCLPDGSEEWCHGVYRH